MTLKDLKHVGKEHEQHWIPLIWWIKNHNISFLKNICKTIYQD
jgi:hypothetical protein